VTDGQRHSIAEAAALLSDPIEVAQRETENALRQFDQVLDLIDDVVRSGSPFRLRPSLILELHRMALDGLSPYAGGYRPGSVEIGMSTHSPPPAHLVAGLMEEMCDRVNDGFASGHAIGLCAYVMWRLNWIHPFTDGNGRTSRALAYYVLCAKLGYRLPGHQTLPEQIAADKTPYYDALEAADRALQAGAEDLSALNALIEGCLATQLLDAFKDASNPEAGSRADRKFH